MSKEPVLIGLTGKAGSGKTWAAKYLEEHHDFARVSFADALRDMLLKLDPVMDDAYGLEERALPWRLSDYLSTGSTWQDFKGYPYVGEEVRRLMQALGDIVRSVDPDYFIQEASRRALELRSEGRDVVVDDVRYDNEAKAIHNYYRGHVVQIGRIDGHEGLPGVLGEHSSEQGVRREHIDYLVPNPGHPNGYEVELAELLNRIDYQR